MKRRRLVCGLVVGLALVAIAIVVSLAFAGRARNLAAVESAVRARFPQVAQISTGALAAWLGDPARAAPRLLDVRTAAEYAVSHLPGARRVEPGVAPPRWLVALAHDTPMVAYCAVGYRSSAYVERLKQLGFSRIYNLQGSIFAWANEERGLVRGTVPTALVHPYDAVWGRLLDPEHRAVVSPAEEERSAPARRPSAGT